MRFPYIEGYEGHLGEGLLGKASLRRDNTPGPNFDSEKNTVHPIRLPKLDLLTDFGYNEKKQCQSLRI